jgi:uncharacterized protein
VIIDLAKLPPGGLRSQGTEAVLPLEGPDGLRDLAWSLFLLPSDPDVYVEVSGQAIWEGTCSRCLEPFDRPLSFRSQYLGSKDADLVARGSHTLGSQDLDVVYLPESELDELALVREQVELQVPMHPLCHEDCQGLCPQCGKNWNKGRCSCPPPSRKEPGALAKALSGLNLNLEP